MVAMTRMLEAWHRRTGPERFETYTRWTLYLLLGMVPLLAASVLGVSELEADRAPFVAAFAGLVVVETGVAIVVIRQGVTAFRDSTPLPRGPVALLLVLPAAAGGAAMVGLPPATTIGCDGRGAGLLLALATCLFAVTPVVTS